MPAPLFFLLLLVLALVTVQRAAAVPFANLAVRVEPSDEAAALAASVFELRTSSAPGCADTITHDQVSDVPEDASENVEGVITFANITVNGEQCQSQGADSVLILYSQDVLDVFLPGGKVLDLTFEASRAVTVGGADMDVRRCGDWIEDFKQSYAFTLDIGRMLPSLDASGLIDNSTISSADLDSNVLWMISAPQDARGRICVYRQAESEPSPTPQPDNSSDEQEDDTDSDQTDSDDTADTNDDATDDQDDQDEQNPDGVFESANDEALELEDQENSDEDAACFPASATVRLEDGSTKTMAQLDIGDRVMVGPRLYSEVFMFTHRVSASRNNFVAIQTNTNHVLHATSAHYIYANGMLMTAGSITQGDVLTLADGSSAQVVAIQSSSAAGLYSPQTMHGDIVVDGIRASTYTDAIQPSTAHALLSPLRAAFAKLSLSTTAFENGARAIVRLLPRAQCAY